MASSDAHRFRVVAASKEDSMGAKTLAETLEERLNEVPAEYEIVGILATDFGATRGLVIMRRSDR